MCIVFTETQMNDTVFLWYTYIGLFWHILTSLLIYLSHSPRPKWTNDTAFFVVHVYRSLFVSICVSFDVQIAATQMREVGVYMFVCVYVSESEFVCVYVCVWQISFSIIQNDFGYTAGDVYIYMYTYIYIYMYMYICTYIYTACKIHDKFECFQETDYIMGWLRLVGSLKL